MEDLTPQGTFEPFQGSGHESTDVGIRSILVFGIILTVVIIVVMAGLAIWYTAMARNERARVQDRPARFADTTGLFPEPRLQSKPILDMNMLRLRESVLLEEYAWVDEPRAVARIPIARAMTLTLRNLQDQEIRPSQSTSDDESAPPDAAAESRASELAAPTVDGEGSPDPEVSNPPEASEDPPQSPPGG